MIRFDMSEYMEKHSVAKLVGALQVMLAMMKAGQLTEKVRPQSILTHPSR